jgi:NADH-quinone oxidoreductase subunit N
MNLSLMSTEIAVVALGLALLLADLWLPAERKRLLGYAAAIGVVLILVWSLVDHSRFVLAQNSPAFHGPRPAFYAFGEMFVVDSLGFFFKHLFLLAAVLVLLLAAEFSDRMATGVAEYYSLILFALAGMLFAASANDFVMLFVSVELITVTFYVLTGFQRGRAVSLEAGVKYLILGALSSAFMVFGIALVWGTSGQFNFNDVAAAAVLHVNNRLFLLGAVLVLAGLGFKIAAFPFQVWAPDVYQGAPTPTTAFLAVGSKAAGFVLLLRFLFSAIPDVTARWVNVLIVISGITILYGNLCAMPQRNLKRLLGYSSIAHAGYLLLGVAALAGAKTTDGGAALLYYLGGYLFTVLAAFMVVALVMRQLDTEDIAGLAGLNQRSPLLATTLTLAMVSLAGIPPLAGFFGKFLLLKAVLELGAVNHGFYCLAFTALAGVVISLYYYFGVIRAAFWPTDTLDRSAIRMSWPIQLAIYVCLAGMLWLGLFPGAMLGWAAEAVRLLKP